MANLQSPIHITELQDFYAALRDGDYWMVFQKGVSILHHMINPHTDKVMATTGRGIGRTTRANRQYPVSAVEQEQFADTVERLQKERDRISGNEIKVKANSRVALATDAPQIDMAGILAIVDLVISIFSRFRGRTALEGKAGNQPDESGLRLPMGGKGNDSDDSDDKQPVNRVQGVNPGVKSNLQPGGKETPQPATVQPGQVVSGGTNTPTPTTTKTTTPPVTKVENPKNK